jgi:tetratricopeptide (TPR) repeat protein
MTDLARHTDADGALLANWAIAYDCVNEPDNALKRLKQSAQKLPWPSTYMNMARHQLKLSRLNDAIQSVDEALKLDPTLEAAYSLRAELFLRQGDSASAARDYARVLLKGHIDNPREGAAISGKAVAGGWAVSKSSAISEVWIYIDNRPLAQAVLGGARPDVAKALPEQFGAATSGWNAIFDTTQTSAGEHSLDVRVRLLDGTFLVLSSMKIMVSK